jgi:hypothetical protein
MEFEPTISVLKREKTVHALDWAATVICYNYNNNKEQTKANCMAWVRERTLPTEHNYNNIKINLMYYLDMWVTDEPITCIKSTVWFIKTACFIHTTQFFCITKDITICSPSLWTFSLTSSKCLQTVTQPDCNVFRYTPFPFLFLATGYLRSWSAQKLLCSTCEYMYMFRNSTSIHMRSKRDHMKHNHRSLRHSQTYSRG